MTKRIFKYTELIILLTLVGGFTAILLLFYNYFGTLQHRQLKTETAITAEAVENGGLDYLNGLKVDNTRVTWIAADGTVLFDNEADPASMNNHAERPEVEEALKDGYGESTRYSKTLTTAMYYSAKRLDNGSVVRVAESRNTVFAIALGMLLPMIWIFILLMILTWFLSSHTAKQIVEPLNNFDLDNPLENQQYPELTPFLHRIYSQQREISVQKESLDRTEKDFVTVTEHMSECLILLSVDGKILIINKQAMKLLHTDDSCIGRNILFLERRVVFQEALKKAAGGEHSELILDFAGRRFQTDISPIPGDEGNESAGMAVLMFDVTDKENAEQMRREFTANVSHELKTPLHTISGCAELLQTGAVKPDAQKKFVDTIYSQAQRMIALVEDILTISHLDEGAGDMKWEDINLMEVSNKVAAQLQQQAIAKHIALTVSGNACQIRGVPQLVDNIIYNLVDNAIKYNKENGSVNIDIRPGDEGTVLSVSDTGIGIPEKDIPRIFERFYRVDKSHSREIGGTGLGLSIVKHAAQTMQAELDVTSQPGRGTTFKVTFPSGDGGKR